MILIVKRTILPRAFEIFPSATQFVFSIPIIIDLYSSGSKRQTFLSYVEVMTIHYSTKEKNNEEREKKEQGEKLCERKGESKTQRGLKLLII